MLNNFIPVAEWKNLRIPEFDCLYGYSHKHAGYLPFKEINEIVKIGRTGRIGVKGIDEYDNKLYIQLFKKDQEVAKERGWLSKFEF